MTHLVNWPVAIAIAATVLVLGPASASAQEFSPYGSASAASQRYGPLKYVLESSAFDAAEVAGTLRVAKQVMSLSPKGSEMSVVIIGAGIRVFARENYDKYQGIVDAAAELRDAGVRIAYCGSSMTAAGYKPADLHGIGLVVPGGYVEVAELVSKGHVHIRPPAVLARTRDARYVDRPELKK
jgi:intracellular sulfur oxidation DsrE/DsrF family protein